VPATKVGPAGAGHPDRVVAADHPPHVADVGRRTAAHGQRGRIEHERVQSDLVSARSDRHDGTGGRGHVHIGTVETGAVGDPRPAQVDRDHAALEQPHDRHVPDTGHVRPDAGLPRQRDLLDEPEVVLPQHDQTGVRTGHGKQHPPSGRGQQPVVVALRQVRLRRHPQRARVQTPDDHAAADRAQRQHRGGRPQQILHREPHRDRPRQHSRRRRPLRRVASRGPAAGNPDGKRHPHHADDTHSTPHGPHQVSVPPHRPRTPAQLVPHATVYGVRPARTAINMSPPALSDYFRPVGWCTRPTSTNGDLLGYPRVSTTDQHPQMEADELAAAGF